MMKNKLTMRNFLELSGNLVYLKKMGSEDLEDFYKLFSDTSVESNIYTGTKEYATKKNLEGYLERIEADSDRADFLIYSIKTNDIVGEVVINDVSTKDRSSNIRVAIFKQENFNKGYGTEAIILALNYGFGMFNLHRIELGVFEFNQRAIHVYEKIGFVKEGSKRDSLYYNHQYYNEIIMSILEDEFRRLYIDNIEKFDTLLLNK